MGKALRRVPATDRGGTLLTPIRWFWLAAALAMAADLASKSLIFRLLGGSPSGDGLVRNAVVWLLPGAFRLILHYNTGGAFGWAAGNVLLFLGATAVLVPVLVVTAYHCREPGSPLWCLGLIVGGAIGNLYDRLFHAGVRDFLEVVNPGTGQGLWPVFNIADVAIVVGVGVYLIWSVAYSSRRRQGA